MITGHDMVVSKRALLAGLLPPRLLFDALTHECTATTRRRGLLETLEAQQRLDSEVMAALRSLAESTHSERHCAPEVRFAELRDLLFGTAAVHLGYCDDATLRHAMIVWDESNSGSAASLASVLVALDAMKPSDVKDVQAQLSLTVAYCPVCDLLFARRVQVAENEDDVARHDVHAFGACTGCDGDLLVGDVVENAPSDRVLPVVLPVRVPKSVRAPTATRKGSPIENDRSNTESGLSEESTLTEIRPLEDEEVAKLAEITPAQIAALQAAARSSRSISPGLADSDIRDAVRAAGETEVVRRNRPGAVQSRGDDALEWRRRTGGPSESTLQVASAGELTLDESRREYVVVRPSEPNAPSFETTTPPSQTVRHEAMPVAGAGADIGVRLGEYVVLSELGRGGMGVVYLARHVDALEPRFAIKFIRQDLSRNTTYVRRFEREVKLVLSLDHPNIVATHDYGQRDGYWYLVMEYVDGENLGDLLEREKSIKVSRAVSIARQTALALASAHERGIVHRDIKPDNIILSRSSRESPAPNSETPIKVTDFGLAKEMAGLDDTLTITGQLIGTPHYMSPEQCRGDFSDQRSDIYSLGCTFYHMLVGRPPFLGDNYLSVMEQQRSESITAPHMINPSVPVSLSFIVGKMMEKNPNDRYPTMDLLIAHLDMWDSSKLVDDVARFAPSFSRVRSTFRRFDNDVALSASANLERLERELRSRRAEVDWLRSRLARQERSLDRARNALLIMGTAGALLTMLVLALGYVFGGR